MGAGTSHGCHNALAVNPALGEAEGEADFFLTCQTSREMSLSPRRAQRMKMHEWDELEKWSFSKRDALVGGVCRRKKATLTRVDRWCWLQDSRYGQT